MLTTVALICLCCCITIFGNVASAQDREDNEVFGAQPKIITQNGHLIFMTADNHNITFKSQGLGTIRINDDDLSAVVSSAKQSVSDLQRIKDEEIVAMRQSISQLQNQMNTITVLNNRVSSIEASLSGNSRSIAQRANATRVQNRELARLRQKLRKLKTRLDNLEELIGKNECNSNPCRNGGTCVDGFRGFTCKCLSNWEGPTCELDFNECVFYAGTDLGCKNGATCVNTLGSFSCQCPPDYYGIHCTERHDDCSYSTNQGALCGHGVCVNQARSLPGQPRYACICDEGWKSDGINPACVVDVDECQTGRSLCSQHPMVQCINLPGSFGCGPCPTGYIGSGFTCMDINECMTNNGGCSVSPFVQCINTPGSRQCGPCPTGFQGNGQVCVHSGLCGINNGGCHPLATCIENPAISSSYMQCQCPAGYVGSGYGPQGCVSTGVTPVISSDPCNPNPCNAGTCVTISSYAFRCNCPLGYSGQRCELSINECVSQPCQNGGTCVDLADGYICTCPSQYTGFNCEQEKDACGGHLNEANGTFRYPSNTGASYPHDKSCAWVITVSSNQVLNLTFPAFNLEATSNCEYDFLQFHDGNSAGAHVIGRFCGNQAPNGGNIITTHNSVYIWFHSDSSVALAGFRVNWQSMNPACGFEINPPVDHGSIKSPGYPGRYPMNRDCIWIVRVPLGKRIQFMFPIFQIEHHDNCNYDFLEIRDGASETDPVISTICDTRPIPPLMSSGSFARLHFHSDSSLDGQGFVISFNSVPGVPGCGGLLTREQGSFTSPDHPNQYEHGLECDWLIRVKPGERIKLTFTAMDLERHSNCLFDYVEVYEGSDDASPLVGRYCGQTIPPTRVSSSNVYFIKFHSDISVARGGFRATYEVACGGYFTSEQGTFHSPNFPNSYPHSKECVYAIHLTPGKAIRLWFEAFDVEGPSLYCYYDYIQVFDGDSPSSPSLGKFCGAQIPEPIISTHNILYLKFATDASVRNRGFLANYTAIDLACGGIILNQTSGVITSPSHPENYLPNTTCRWIIRPPTGFLIRLDFTVFTLESSRNCVFDYVAVYDNVTTEDNHRLMGRFCGSQLPPLLTSSDNLLYVKFQSDVTVTHDGFTAQFTAFDASNFCGGNYYSTMGIIQSPNYPNAYPDGRQCTWTIRVQNGQQILLNVTDFQLEASSECRYDFLEIRNGGYMTSPLIGKFCGMQIPPLIPSHSNQLFLKFVSDSSFRTKGFRILWDGTATGCGGELISSEGSISSPGYPMGCNSYEDCSWRITVNKGNKVRMLFTDLDIAASPNCHMGVQIFDGNSAKSKSLGRFCGTQIVDPFTSTSNEVFIKFRCIGFMSSDKRGFHLTYSTVCNNTLSGRRGIIETPNFPNSYPHNRNCTWTISAPLSATLNMSFSILRLEHTPNCSFDFVEIKEAIYRNKTTIGKFCGVHESPPMIFSTTNKVQVNFASDYGYADNGFALEWVSSGCGGLLTKRSGNFTSPNYPNPYPQNVVCEWEIRVDYGQSIELTVYDYDMESGVGCIYDSIKVYGNADVDAPFSLLTSICHAQSSPVIVTSHDNQLYVVFKSDYNVVGKGFRASYVTKPGGCGGRFTVPTGVIRSRNYPNPYDAHDDCTWLVSVEKGHTVFLNFTDFDVRANGNCSAVYVAIYDGTTENDTLLMKHCGTQLPIPLNYSSTSSDVLIRMRAHAQFSGRGFNLNYFTDCGATLYADEPGEIYASNYIYNLRSNPSSFYYWNAKNCTWIIRARRLEDRVALTVTSLYFYQSSFRAIGPCTSQYINIYDGESNDSVLLDHLCRNSSAPPTYISQGNSLRVLFNGRLNTVLFRATYYEASTACGGELKSLQGTITSPEYPNSYPVEMECVWTIATSPGNRVGIAFSYFNLEESDYCNKDYVEIRETNVFGRLLGRYCGAETPALNFTAKHQLWVKFRSDLDGVGQGFVASYSMLHGSFLSGSSGQIASPMYPDWYPQSGKVAWTVTVPADRVVGITFIDVYFPSTSLVCYFGLKIYDGPDETASVIGDFCRSLIPTPIVSNTNVVYIVLSVPMWSSRATKFLLNWNATKHQQIFVEEPTLRVTNVTGCSGTFYLNSTDVRDSELFLTSPGFPTGYHANLHCEWIIYAPLSMSVGISFTTLDLEDYYNCYSDAVEIWGVGIVPGQWETYGRHCRRSETTSHIRSYSNAMKVTFNTDSSVNMTGFSAHLYPVCGGNVTASAGVVQSYGYPRSYFHGLKCDWLITVRPGRRIQLHFSQFQLEGDMPACPNDYLILRNGMSSNSPPIGSGKYCGSSRPESIETIGNHMYVQFVSNEAVTAEGFQFAFSEVSSSCGGVIMLTDSNPSVRIETPNYPSFYPYLTDCTWRVFAPVRRRIHLHFDSALDIPLSEGCQTDFVVVHDGGSRHSHLLEKYCDVHHNLSTLQSTANSMFIEFSSTSHVLSSGFKATIRIGDCGGTIIAEEGSITSPNYPNNYAANLNCEWIIRGPPGHFFIMAFQALETFVRYRNCSASDFVQIRDSNATGTLLGTFCGRNTTVVVQTLDNVAYVRFSTRQSSSLSNKGFILNFNRSSEECGGELSTPSGIITSPNFPRPFPRHRYCQWTIRAIRGRKVRVIFTDFNVDSENNDYCDGGSVAFFNGDADHLLPPYYICGNRIPVPVLSTSNALKMRFYSGNQVTGTGFRAIYDTNLEWDCGGDLPLPVGNLTSPGYGAANYSHHMMCTWYLENPQINSTFVFRIHDFILEEPNIYGCIYDAFEIIRGTDGLFASLCGRVDSDRVFAVPFSQLQLNFKSDQSVAHSGFSLSYASSNCGGEIPETGSIVSSPNYPSPYPRDIHCAWAVSFPEGQQVQITFEDFLLESSANCTSAVLIVRNGLSLNSPIIGRYCGSEKPQEILTQVHEALIEFHVNLESSSTSRGFRFNVIPVASGCGGIFHANNGILTSVGHPNDYPNDIECEWIFEAEPGFFFNITFVERFDLEMDSSCSKDFIEGFDTENHMWKSVGRICGRDFPPPFLSSSNKFRMLFRSNGGVYGDGFKANWTTQCGGIFTDMEGSFQSPGYPVRYLNLLDCTYLIASDPRHYVIVTFDEKFGLEAHTECNYDVLEVYGGNTTTSPLLQRTCSANIAPSTIIHVGPVLFRFTTDSSGAYAGFRVSYRISECGGTLGGPAGIISSPLHPDTYHANMRCTWTVIAPPDRIIIFNARPLNFHYCSWWQISHCGISIMTIPFYTRNVLADICKVGILYANLPLKSACADDADEQTEWLIEPYGLVMALLHCTIQSFRFFDLEGGSCYYDSVTIHDGNSTSSRLLGRYCGNTLPSLVRTTGNIATVIFVTDYVIEHKGFEMVYRVTYGESSGCGGFLNTTSGTIRSVDLDQDGNYEPGLDCVWLISAVPFKAIQLNFQTFNLEDPKSPGAPCSWDYLEIRDGMSSSSSLISRFCGTEIPAQITSSSNKLWLTFVSDNSINRPGFSATYTVVDPECGGVLNATNDVQTIESPAFPGNYRVNLRCHWIIDKPSIGHNVRFSFQELKLENSTLCHKDYLIIENAGPTLYRYLSEELLRKRYCGSSVPGAIAIYSNQIHVRFGSDSTQTDKGFKVSFSLSTCNNMTYTASSGLISEPYFNSTGTSNVCVERIAAPTGMTITLSFMEFGTPYSENCSQGYLEVRDGANESAPLFGRFCNWMLPSPIYSTSNNLWIKFNISLGYSIFDAVYFTSSQGSGCGGTLFVDRGIISSPLYPGNYSRDSVCKWKVTVPQSHSIKINFRHIEILPEGNCTTNFLEIYDGTDVDDSHRLGTYCGTQYRAPIDTATNSMILKYVTDTSNSGEGFQIAFHGIEMTETQPIIDEEKP